MRRRNFIAGLASTTAAWSVARLRLESLTRWRTSMRAWLAVGLTLICTAVFGHGNEQWISDAKLVDPVSKGLCCGPTDCSVLAPGSVEHVQGGYKVNTGRWTGYDPFFVAWDRALPLSPDGHYHVCITSDAESSIPTIRCFI